MSEQSPARHSYFSYLLLAILCLLGVQVGLPSLSYGQLVDYDDFAGPFIDPAKWLGNESPGNNNNANTEAMRHIQEGALRLYLITHGGVDIDEGRRTSRFGLQVTLPEFLTAMQADVTIAQVAAQSCEANTSETRSRAQLIARFFNDGSSPGPGDSTGDIFAGIQKVRSTASGDRIEAFAGRCSNAPCSSSTVELFFAFESPMIMGQTDTLQMIWDDAGSQFLYAVNTGTPEEETVALSYAELFTNMGPPNFNVGRLRANNSVVHCTASRKMAVMEALYDNIRVNPEAVPPPDPMAPMGVSDR